MIYLLFFIILLPNQVLSQDTLLSEDSHSKSSLLKSQSFAQNTSSHDTVLNIPLPKSSIHPVLSKSAFAKTYTEKTTLCCFIGRKWFKVGAFVSTTAAAALSGIAYGVEDTTIKDNCNLAILIATVLATTFNRLEGYATDSINDHENEYQMFENDTLALKV